MPLDANYITCLTKELAEKLYDAKIEKAQMPSRSQVLFPVRAGETRRLFFGAGGGAAKLYLTEREYPVPAEPPMFCMLLRKHLVGARILSITQPEGERIIKMELLSPGTFGDGEKRALIFELMGRYANIILTDGDGIITDCLYRIGGADEKRAVLPGLRYRLPPAMEKVSPFGLTEDAFSHIFASAEDGAELNKWLVSSFCGFSPLTAREICFRAYGDISMRVSEARERDGGEAVFKELSAASGLIAAGKARPYIIRKPDGTPFDFSYMPILQYGPGYELSELSSFSAVLEEFYASREEKEQSRQRTSELHKLIKGRRERVARRLSAQREELLKTEDRESLRECGDIITSNMHTMKKGMSVLRAYDYYSEDGGEREIQLDPLKTPQQNAARYYKDYARAKSAEKHLTEQIRLGEEELSYLDSVLDELSRTENQGDVAAIRAELENAGFLRIQKGAKRQKVREDGFLRFKSDAGFIIRAGKNNMQNDRLTLKESHKTDIWLHTQKIHGSHVVISCDGVKPDEKTLIQAAAIAAYHSEGRGGSHVPVDYALVKYVKKPSGAKPGMVIYTDYKTVYVNPDEELVKRLRIKRNVF